METITTLVGGPRSQAFDTLKSYLCRQNDIEVVGHASNDVQTLWFVRTLDPAVVLLDVDSAETGGLAAIVRIRALNPVTRFVLFSLDRTDAFIARALQRGAHGCVSAPSEHEQCVRAIRAVYAGELWV